MIIDSEPFIWIENSNQAKVVLFLLGLSVDSVALSGVDGVDICGELTDTPLSVLEMLISRSNRRVNL